MTNHENSKDYSGNVFWQEILGHKSSLMVQAVKHTKNFAAAEDLFHDTVLQAFRQKNNFTAGTNLKSWLSTIMKGHFYNGVRKNPRTIDYQELENILPEDTHDTFMEYYDKISHDFEIVLSCLATLEDSRCSSLIMYHFGGYTYEEVAEEMSLKAGTAKAYINRAITIVATRISNGDIVICDINLWITEKIVSAHAEKQMLLVKTYQVLLSSYNSVRIQTLIGA